MSDEEVEIPPEGEGEEEDAELDGEEIEGGDEEQEAEEEEDKSPPNPLAEDLIAESLSLLCKTGDGLAHAYVRLDIHDRELTDIELLSSFIHLRYIDVSKNFLKDISPLSSLTHMLTLKADDNLLTTAKLEEMPFLQVASFNNNKINTTEGINHPMLEHLSLNNNQIKEVSGFNAKKLSRLHTLELRGNKLETTEGFYLPYLKNLFLAANMIKKIEGMSSLPGLTTFHLRENQLENLHGFDECQTSLQYINLRGNLVTSVKECAKLKILPNIRALVLSENPCAEEDDYRMETLIGIRTLERLDKDEYTEEERTEAEEIYQQRKQEEEDKAAMALTIMDEIHETEIGGQFLDEEEHWPNNNEEEAEHSDAGGEPEATPEVNESQQ